MSEAFPLSAAQVDQFRANGFLALDRITTPQEIGRFRPIYDRLFVDWQSKAQFTPRDLAGGKGREAGGVVQMHDISRNVPEFAASLMRCHAESIARQLLGPDAEFVTDHAISKAAGSESHTPWHQDQWYWDPQAEYRRVSVWVPLQDVTPANGCMCYVSRRHAPDTIPHHKQDYDPDSHAWEADRAHFDESLAVACPLPAGGAAIHYGKTLHYASGNRSTQPRRAYIVSCSIVASEGR